MEVKPQMQDSSIQQVSPNSTALNAEHYQTYEMAKANDDVLGGDNLKELIAYQARVRAEAQVIHKLASTMNSWDDLTTAKAETVESEQTLARVNVFIDQRMGEVLREMPKAKAGRKPNSVVAPTELTKSQAEKDAGISHAVAIDLQKMAANPEVVQAVIAKAEQDGRVVSRSQVLKAIKERDELKSKLDSIEHPKPEVIEREVIPDHVQMHIDSLERDAKVYADTNQKLRRQLEEKRKELERAKVLLDGKNHIDNASWDISVLTTATNNYLSQYGGKAWAFEQFDHADEVTRQEFVKAINSLAVFAQNLAQMISDQNKLEA